MQQQSQTHSPAPQRPLSLPPATNRIHTCSLSSPSLAVAVAGRNRTSTTLSTRYDQSTQRRDRRDHREQRDRRDQMDEGARAAAEQRAQRVAVVEEQRALRARLHAFFMTPCGKWRHRRASPCKMILQVLLWRGHGRSVLVIALFFVQSLHFISVL